MKSNSSAVCSIGKGNSQDITTEMMVDPPYHCMPEEDYFNFVEEFKTNQNKLENLLHE